MTRFDRRMAELRLRFLTRLRSEREQLILAIASGDGAEIRRISHGLSGAGGVFGLPQISEAAQLVEEAADAGVSLPDLKSSCRPLLDEMERVLQGA